MYELCGKSHWFIAFLCLCKRIMSFASKNSSDIWIAKRWIIAKNYWKTSNNKSLLIGCCTRNNLIIETLTTICMIFISACITQQKKNLQMSTYSLDIHCLYCVRHDERKNIYNGFIKLFICLDTLKFSFAKNIKRSRKWIFFLSAKHPQIWIIIFFIAS